MPAFLLEFFSEEIPARMQKRAEEDLVRLLGAELEAAGLGKLSLRTMSGPRRIAIMGELPAGAASVNEERKGPRVGAPEQALAGFLKAAGLARIEDAQIQKDPKGDFYVARIAREGRATPAILAEAIPKTARAFPWPKSMRSGTSDFTWVRPLHEVLCLFDGAPVAFEVGGVKSGARTWGHRFHSAGAIEITDPKQYEEKLRAAFVLADREVRKAKILADAKAACAARALSLVEDAGLLEEVAGLAEWPVVVLGDMDPAFLDLPAEVIRLTMRTHQRYFAVRGADGRLAPHFVTVANVEAKDGGKAIAAGNARVLSARLNDARFFWEQDRKLKLGDPARVEKLKSIVFHQKLGSVWDKVERVAALAQELALVAGADPALVARAARLAKCDLVTETVGEFPELQGQIGRQLAELEGEHPSVAAAIEDHYRPLGPNDRVPSDPVAITLALADKLDTLVGFWAIDEKPTGSRDPYALRRAALGICRVLLENNVRLGLRTRLALAAFVLADVKREQRLFAAAENMGQSLASLGADLSAQVFAALAEKDRSDTFWSKSKVGALGWLSGEVLAFLADRLKVQLREQGKRHDLVDSVFALGDDDLVRIVARVEALESFLKTEDGANLLAGYRRAANILAAEEKKGRGLSEADAARGYDRTVLAAHPQPAEQALLDALARVGPQARQHVEDEKFEEAMTAMAGLRAPLDRFFNEVLVNDEDADVRRNRMLLLGEIREALRTVADFSKIEG